MVIKNIVGAVDSWLAWEVRDTLNQHKNDEVTLIVTSNGGVVAHAVAISDMLARHGNVTVEFSGVAASAATWMAFGAKRVVMHEDTLWLCHQCSTLVSAWENMKVEDLDKYIEKLNNEKKSLEVLDAIVAKKYLDRCGKKKNLKDVVELMKEERYLAPSDVLEWGFVDEIIPGKTAQNVVNSLMLKELNLPEANIAPTVSEPKNAAPTVDEESLISRIVDKLKGIFCKKDEQDPAEEPANTHEELNSNHTIMNKTFTFVNGLLKSEGVQQNDEKNIVLTPEQMQLIENRLADADKAEKAMDKISDKLASINGVENKVNALSFILDKFPTSPAPDAQLPGAKQEASNEIVIENGDEVNEYLKTSKSKLWI